MLPVPSQRGQGPVNPIALANPRLEDPESTLMNGFPVLICPDIPDRIVSRHRKTDSPRSAPYETDTVAFKNHWRVS